MIIFYRDNLKIVVGDQIFDVQAPGEFCATDPRMPFWIAEMLETQELKRQFKHEELCRKAEEKKR